MIHSIIYFYFITFVNPSTIIIWGEKVNASLISWLKAHCYQARAGERGGEKKTKTDTNKINRPVVDHSFSCLN